MTIFDKTGSVRYNEIPDSWNLEDDTVWMLYPDDKHLTAVKQIKKDKITINCMNYARYTDSKMYKRIFEHFDFVSKDDLTEYIIAKYGLVFILKDHIIAGQFMFMNTCITNVIAYALNNDLVDTDIMKHAKICITKK